MKVLFGVKEAEPSPGPRYRVLQFLPALEAAGVRCQVLVANPKPAFNESTTPSAAGRALRLARSWGRGHAFFAHLLRAIDDADRLYLYRVALPQWVVPALERRKARVFYDFDDALGAVDGFGTWQGLRQRFWDLTIERAIRCSRTIVTSNAYNADAVRARGGVAVVVPTCVDTARYPYRSRRETNGVLRIGWIGTPSTAAYLRAIEEPLARLAAVRPVEICLVGAGHNPFAGPLQVGLRRWCLDTEVDEISRFDIGLMPMPDTPWTRGKAALKALQYGASGAPTVASWTPTNEEILGAGNGTSFCRTPEDWFRELLRLVDDGELRDSMGAQARRHVETHYSVAVNVPRLLDILRQG